MKDSAQRSWQLIVAVCQTESRHAHYRVCGQPSSYRMAIRASVSARITKEPKREYDRTLLSRADIKEERVFTTGLLYLTLTKRTEMGGKLRNRKFHNVYSSHNIVRTI